MNAQPSRDDFNLDASRDPVGAFPRTALQEAVNNDAAEEYGKLAFTLLDRENVRNFHLMEEINRERARRDLAPFPISYPAPDNGLRRRLGDKPQEAVGPEYTGGRVSYYRVKVERPTSADVAPYIAECNDIIEALNLNYAEGNALKAIWRMAAARMGKLKKGYTDGKYDAEKVVFFGQRMVAQNAEVI